MDLDDLADSLTRAASALHEHDRLHEEVADLQEEIRVRTLLAHLRPFAVPCDPERTQPMRAVRPARGLPCGAPSTAR